MQAITKSQHRVFAQTEAFLNLRLTIVKKRMILIM